MHRISKSKKGKQIVAKIIGTTQGQILKLSLFERNKAYNNKWNVLVQS